MALGAMAGIAVLLKKAREYNLPDSLRFGDWRTLNRAQIERILNWLWMDETCEFADQLIEMRQECTEVFGDSGGEPAGRARRSNFFGLTVF